MRTLRALPGVKVENRWVPECEVSAIMNWADIVVMPYREASRAAAFPPTALAAGRRVVATRVGGLPEQLKDEPLATLCEPDAASLAAALMWTLERPNDFVSPRPAILARPGADLPRACWQGWNRSYRPGYEEIARQCSSAICRGICRLLN